jgi:hypothetical protein
MRLWPNRVRAKLTLSYIFLLAILLMCYVACISFLFLRQVRVQLSRHAIEDLETIEGLLFFTASGKLELREDFHHHLDSMQLQERLVEIRSLTALSCIGTSGWGTVR